MSANDLSALLWRERELLELLTFKLEVEQLLLTAGRTRWIDHATREVEQVLDRLRGTGLERSVAVSELAREWGTDDEAPLRDLVAAAPVGPWGEIFGAHLAAMTELTERIARLRDENERFLRAAARATQEALAGSVPDDAPLTYDATGQRPGTGTADVTGGRIFDGSL